MTAEEGLRKDAVENRARIVEVARREIVASVWRELTNHSLGPIGDAITVLLDAGKGAGQIRDDADAGDVILLTLRVSRPGTVKRPVTAVALVRSRCSLWPSRGPRHPVESRKKIVTPPSVP